MTMELELDKESSFVLEMKIDGDVASSDPPKMRFSIVSEHITLSLVAKRIDNGIYEISVPKLKGILEAGEYEADVEVFIDGKHFIPMKQTIKLKQELTPIVKLAESKNSPTPNITVDKIEIKKPLIRKTDNIITVPK